MKRIFLLGAAAAVAASAQKPVINPRAIVNAANYAESGVIPGSLVSIFGSNLATTTESATSLPLPKTLAGTTVTFDGVPAPLLYVSPGQINAQFPASAVVPGEIRPLLVIVQNALGTSDPEPVPTRLIDGSFGIFTLDATGCGRAAIFNVEPDGTRTRNGPDHSVEPGGFIEVYATGLEPRSDRPPDGEPAPLSPLILYPGSMALMIRGRKGQSWSPLNFAGLAPGLVGLNQINTLIPTDAPEGCAIPIQLTNHSFSTTQPVPLSIRRGGGRCVDPPPDSVAVLRWKKVIYTEPNGRQPSDTLTIDFTSAIGNILPVPLVSPLGTCNGGEMLPPGPRCRDVEDRRLDAGVLTVEGPGLGPLRITPTLTSGQPLYRVDLPEGAIREGTFVVSGAGGADVGPFRTSVQIPPAIQNVFAMLPRLNTSGLFSWAGGDARTVVSGRVTGTAFRLVRFIECVAPASDGRILYPFPGLQVPSGMNEAIFIQTGDPAKTERFQAQGLTLGGVHEWEYEIHYGVPSP